MWASFEASERRGAGLPGRKRGIFVLVVDETEVEDSAMNTLQPEQSSQEIIESRRNGFPATSHIELTIVMGVEQPTAHSAG
jgi:hypothetical protein